MVHHSVMPNTPIESPVFNPSDGPAIGPETPLRASAASWWSGAWKVAAITAIAVFGYAALVSADRDATKEIEATKRVVSGLASKDDIRLLKYEMREALSEWTQTAEIWCEKGDGAPSNMKCRMVGRQASWRGSGDAQGPGR
jgi:hypothetical protein